MPRRCNCCPGCESGTSRWGLIRRQSARDTADLQHYAVPSGQSRLPAARRDKINCSRCLKHDFVGVRVDFSDYAMSVLTPNVFETVQLITQKFGHFSASAGI
jgi:hypothetical protein